MSVIRSSGFAGCLDPQEPGRHRERGANLGLVGEIDEIHAQLTRALARHRNKRYVPSITVVRRHDACTGRQ